MYHLIHPAMVHFSVAFLVFGSLCEAWGLLGRKAAAERLGATLVLFGSLSLVPTLVTGYLAANTLNLGPRALDMLDGHESTGWVVLGVFIVLLFWKGWYRGRLPSGQRVVYAIALTLAALLVAYGAFLGGQMVYGEGVGVTAVSSS